MESNAESLLSLRSLPGHPDEFDIEYHRAQRVPPPFANLVGLKIVVYSR